MPELPEVETIRRGLAKELIGQTIRSVDVRVAKLFQGDSNKIIGQKVLEIERRAKILIWKLDSCYLLMHLKMTGQLLFMPNESPRASARSSFLSQQNNKKRTIVVGGHPDTAYTLDLPHKHTHVIFTLDNGTLYFNDLRKFGWIKVVDSLDEVKPHVAALGPEYTWPEFTLDYFTTKLLKRKSSTIKQSLLDQTILAGLGNIYADETLFLSKIHPKRKIADLTPKEIRTIFDFIPQVLNTSLKLGGTSSKDYFKADGSKGTYLKVANVYKREGLPCNVCGTPIERIKIAGRSSRFCPNCQK